MVRRGATLEGLAAVFVILGGAACGPRDVRETDRAKEMKETQCGFRQPAFGRCPDNIDRSSQREEPSDVAYPVNPPPPPRPPSLGRPSRFETGKVPLGKVPVAVVRDLDERSTIEQARSAELSTFHCCLIRGPHVCARYGFFCGRGGRRGWRRHRGR